MQMSEEEVRAKIAELDEQLERLMGEMAYYEEELFQIEKRREREEEEAELLSDGR